MPSRWLIPSENVLVRRSATVSKPTMPRTSSTRLTAILLLRASQTRWSYALRPPCTALASSKAPTSRRGAGSST